MKLQQPAVLDAQGYQDSFWALGGYHRAPEAGQRRYIVAIDFETRTPLTARFETKILGAVGGGAGDWNRTRGSWAFW